jgi:hypothetical protein
MLYFSTRQKILLLIYLLALKAGLHFLGFFLRETKNIQRRHRWYYKVHCKNRILDCWYSRVGDRQEPRERGLPAAPWPLPASARLASPVRVAAALLTGVASVSSISSAKKAAGESSSPWWRPCVNVAVLESTGRSAAAWGRVG